MSELPDSPEALLDGLRKTLQFEWEKHRSVSYNPTGKGHAYEQSLRNYLAQFFDGVYDIRTNISIIDENFDCFECFSPEVNEWDVVACFRQAVPGIVFRSGEMEWVPYVAVAFICESKSLLTKQSLEDDIERFAKLQTLETPQMKRRFHGAGRTKVYSVIDGQKKHTMDVTVNHPLKCLVYDKKEIADKTFRSILDDTSDIWDMVLLVEDDDLFMSERLPFVDHYHQKTWGDFPFDEVDGLKDSVIPSSIGAVDEGTANFILHLTNTIPRPSPFLAGRPLNQLINREWPKPENERI